MKKATSVGKKTKSGAKEGKSGAGDAGSDWRDAMLGRIRELIKEADPEVVGD